MHVLVTEGQAVNADWLIERLERIGCRVSTCHNWLNVCRVLGPGGQCPLDGHENVDLMVDVRASNDELTIDEFGVICAMRANVPLFIVSTDPDKRPAVPAGLQRWSTAVSAKYLIAFCRDIQKSREQHSFRRRSNISPERNYSSSSQKR